LVRARHNIDEPIAIGYALFIGGQFLQFDSPSPSVPLDATGLKFGLVVGRFNSSITEKLLAGASEAFLAHGGSPEEIEVVWVPGSLEIPLVLKILAKQKKFDALIALGAIIRGETLHFELVSSEVSRGITEVSLAYEIPVTSGIIAAENPEQALERAGGKVGNYGTNAALAAIEMVQILKSIDQGRV